MPVGRVLQLRPRGRRVGRQQASETVKGKQLWVALRSRYSSQWLVTLQSSSAPLSDRSLMGMLNVEN